MYTRAPSTPGASVNDTTSEDDNANEHTPLSGGVLDGNTRLAVNGLRGGGGGGWLLRRRPRQHASSGASGRRVFNLRGALQAVGLLKKPVVYLPRRVPLDRCFPATTAGGGDQSDEGLAAALAVPNVVRNQKYRAATFVFAVLYEQFRYFFNLYFLLVALSQFVPELQVGFLFTYIAPLAFVLGVTLTKEGYDDYQRYVRDKQSNCQEYQRLAAAGGLQSVPSSQLRVGDLVVLPAGARVPADVVLLRTSEAVGTVFVRCMDGWMYV